MTGETIHISTRVIGQRKPVLSDWSIDLPPSLPHRDDGSMTLRDLLTHIVTTAVERFTKQQSDNQFLIVLSNKEIQAQAQRGKVFSGGSDLKQNVDTQQAIDTALQAFEDGLFLVFVDEHEQKNLDAAVYLHADSQVAFVRLVMLAGG